MPRRLDTRPTTIYWLVDMRPETIAKGWLHGYPFYCGKTVATPEKRLWEHRATADIKPSRTISKWILACGEHIKIQVKQVVPTEESWADAERHWISALKTTFPVCANSNSGGAGAPGYVHTAETRELIRKLHTGRKRSALTCARIAAALVRRHNPNGIKKKRKTPTKYKEYLKRVELVKKRNSTRNS